MTTKQPRGIRNNNPGNIRRNSYPWQGLATAKKNMSIRLAVVDGKKVEGTFDRVGRTGKQVMDRTAVRPYSFPIT